MFVNKYKPGQVIEEASHEPQAQEGSYPAEAKANPLEKRIKL